MNIIPELQNVIIEVTRKCNMKCLHCLRGGVQNLNIDLTYIDTFMKQVGYISSIVFTGGEPSLNVDAIKFTLAAMKKYDVRLGGFYIATNGKKITEEFALICIRLYAYAEEKEMCSVVMSNDQFHDNVQVSELLQGLAFFSKRYPKGRNEYILREGRAVDLNAEGKIFCSEIDSRESFQEGEIYLNAKGEIINGCDWSFANQKKHFVCKVDDMADTYESLLNDVDYE